MAEKTQFEINRHYNFNVHAVSILGIQRNVEVLGVVDHETASLFNDVAALHTNVYSSLPEGTVQDDYRAYSYLIFKTTNGSKVAYGLPWIDGDSVEVIGIKSAFITIPNVGADDVENIRKALIAIGKIPSNIELK